MTPLIRFTPLPTTGHGFRIRSAWRRHFLTAGPETRTDCYGHRRIGDCRGGNLYPDTQYYGLVKWAGFYVTVIAVLVGDKRNVQIIDLSEPAAIYQVDNVLPALRPASLITRIGAGMAQVYGTQCFARPDALTYSKTGMLFGAQLAAGAVISGSLSRKFSACSLITSQLRGG